MSGHLAVVGLGPGRCPLPHAGGAAALAAADALYGYAPYLDRVPARAGQSRHASDNREERARAAAALRSRRARARRVAVVSGGDPGVFAMAAAVCEAIEAGPAGWRALDIAIVPGITAMLAVAARIGAPLGHDFCALSLSDNLKPWELIERRLDAAAARRLRHRALQSGLAGAAVAARRRLRAPAPAPAALDAGRLRPRGRARRTSDVSVTTLAAADAADADMATLVIVGSRETRVIARATGARRSSTPRAPQPRCSA